MLPTTSSDSYRVREAATAQLKLRADLVFTPQEFGGRPCYLIEDPLRSKFFRLGVAEYTLVSLFDGRTSIAEALRLTAPQLGSRAFTEPEALAIARWLIESQLATTPESAGAERLAAVGGDTQLRRFAAACNPLAIRFCLLNPDRWLAAMLPWCGWLLSWPALAIWCVVLLLGLSTAALNWEQFTDHSAILLDPGNWLRLAAAWTGLKILHESFHALACKKFGGNVLRAGVMLLFFAPVAYTDVTSSWRFRSKWQRIAVSAAGMYAELFVAALAIVLWARTDEGLVHCLAYDVALMASVGTLVFNANPLMRFDGYFILADLVGVPNLYSGGRQAVVNLVRRNVLGLYVPQPAGAATMRRLMLTYGLATLVWLVLLYTSLALLAIGFLSYLGLTLVGLFVVFAIALPLWRVLRESVRNGSFDRSVFGGRWRIARTAVVGAAVALVAAWALARPGRVEAPAVVEYAPLTEIRATTPGFVRQVSVHSGELVQPGQIVVVLENPDLAAELAELRVQVAQSDAKARSFVATGETAKYQAEMANQKALEKRVAELSRQVAELTVRSPARGHLVGRDLRSLVGQYLQPGAEIALVGDENDKELVVAVGQDDLASFQAQLAQPVRVRISGTAAADQTWELARLDPQAGLTTPHAALSSRSGGPLPVKMKLAPSKPATSELAEHDELLRPCFKASVRIPSGSAVQLYAGQRATVSFQSTQETAGSRLWRALRQWVRERLDRVGAAAAPEGAT